MRELRQASDMVDLDYPPLLIDRVEDAVAPGPQALGHRLCLRRPLGLSTARGASLLPGWPQ